MGLVGVNLSEISASRYTDQTHGRDRRDRDARGSRRKIMFVSDIVAGVKGPPKAVRCQSMLKIAFPNFVNSSSKSVCF